MKKTLLSALLLAPVLAFAQPVINDGSNWPAPGLSSPLAIGMVAGPGNAGANVTWDFSSAPLNTVGTIRAIELDSFPFIGDYVTASHVMEIIPSPGSPLGSKNLYNVYNLSTLKLDNIASTVDTPGQGNDYSPNAKLRMKFPFNYGDTITDYWQKIGSSQSTVRIEYDGYGTLNLPNGVSYTNVIRVKSVYSNGDDYDWYTVNPLVPVAVFDHNTNLLYALTAVPVGKATAEANSLQVYPNPAHDQLMINSGTWTANRLRIMDISGKLVQDIQGNGTALNRVAIDGLQAGVYLIQVETAEGVLIQKFTKE